jgi:hypothetical protein
MMQAINLAICVIASVFASKGYVSSSLEDGRDHLRIGILVSFEQPLYALAIPAFGPTGLSGVFPIAIIILISSPGYLVSTGILLCVDRIRNVKRMAIIVSALILLNSTGQVIWMSALS